MGIRTMSAGFTDSLGITYEAAIFEIDEIDLCYRLAEVNGELVEVVKEVSFRAAYWASPEAKASGAPKQIFCDKAGNAALWVPFSEVVELSHDGMVAICMKELEKAIGRTGQ